MALTEQIITIRKNRFYRQVFNLLAANTLTVAPDYSYYIATVEQQFNHCERVYGKAKHDVWQGTFQG